MGLSLGNRREFTNLFVRGLSARAALPPARNLTHEALVQPPAENASDYVILSGAKDLLLFVFNKKQQMLLPRLRDQHDRWSFSIDLLD